MAANTRLLGYPIGWLTSDLVAGVTLAAYAIPVSLAYATPVNVKRVAAWHA